MVEYKAETTSQKMAAQGGSLGSLFITHQWLVMRPDSVGHCRNFTYPPILCCKRTDKRYEHDIKSEAKAEVPVIHW